MPNSEKKRKGAVVTLPEDDPDAVVYEVWHVRVPPSRLLLTPLTIISGDMEKPWIPRIPPADAAVHSALHRGWLLHQRCGGFVGVCRSVSFLPQFFVPISPIRACTDENRYEKRKRRTTPVTETYHFVGYSSLYPFYCFPDKVRLRLRSVSLHSLIL
jgi:hypothetical protein